MLDKENLYLMDKTKNYYVLFDNDVFGVIESVKRESDSETSRVFTIKGSLALKLLEYRVIKGQLTFKGKSYKYIEEFPPPYSIPVNLAEHVPIELDVPLLYVLLYVPIKTWFAVSQLCPELVFILLLPILEFAELPQSK
jgi:hypothetical protein